MTEERRFVITGEQRDEILNFMSSKNNLSARNMLNQLPTLEEFLKSNKLEKEVENGTSEQGKKRE